MVRKKKGFANRMRTGVLVCALVGVIGLLLHDVFRSEGIFRFLKGKYACVKKVLPAPSTGPVTSVVHVQSNFHIVSPGVWRSAQPNPESLGRMRSYGLKTIINLRLEEEAEPWENEFARDQGIQYFRFPLLGDQIPPLKTVDAILSILSDPERQPVLVHCAAGKDRTGMIIAAYKLANTDVRFRDIYQEMKMYGYDEVGCAAMLETLRLWSESRGRLEASQEIALAGQELAKR